MTTIPGFIAVHPERVPNIHDVARSMARAWHNISESKPAERLAREGWRVVPCRLVIEDGK